MPTETYGFGSGKREGHDSSRFYSSGFYIRASPEGGKRYGRSVPPGFPESDRRKESNEMTEESIRRPPKEVLNRIFRKSSEDMGEIPDRSVHLTVTSPPYNVGKEYDEGLDPHTYFGLMEKIFREVYRVTVPSGRVCINVAGVGRKPYIPLHVMFIELMLGIGFDMMGEIIWSKRTAGSSAAWGSFASATAPVIRDEHEYILVFVKGCYRRTDRRPECSDITPGEFVTFTRSIWEIGPESARRVGHPAPFPVALPEACIRLFSFPHDVVLDPFMGSGSTAVAAVLNGRYFIGYEKEEKYVRLALERLYRATGRPYTEGGPLFLPNRLPIGGPGMCRKLRQKTKVNGNRYGNGKRQQ